MCDCGLTVVVPSTSTRVMIFTICGTKFIRSVSNGYGRSNNPIGRLQFSYLDLIFQFLRIMYQVDGLPNLFRIASILDKYLLYNSNGILL